MQEPSENKAFIFNSKIENDSISALYENDFAYIEEIFSITLSQLKPDVSKLPGAFQSNDLPELRKLVHKIKPSFGFVGMNATQALCKAFEDSCSEATNTEVLKVQFDELHLELAQAVNVLELEWEKLKEYNKS